MEYNFKEFTEQHECESWKEGDWLVFHCEKCGYIRKLNYRTGQTVLDNPGDNKVGHYGAHSPVGLCGLRMEQQKLN